MPPVIHGLRLSGHEEFFGWASAAIHQSIAALARPHPDYLAKVVPLADQTKCLRGGLAHGCAATDAVSASVTSSARINRGRDPHAISRLACFHRARQRHRARLTS